MKILIVGAGGIGGFFGARLIQAGADVNFLLREKRKALIDRDGLTIETPSEQFTIHPQTYLANELSPIYDLIILAPKAYDLPSSLESVKNVSVNAVFLPFLNGLTHLDRLDKEFGRDRVMGGIAHIGATISPSGSIRQLTDLSILTVGARSPSHQNLASQFYNLCKRAKFTSVFSENIEQSLWDKWVFLATLAGMTTLMDGNVGEIIGCRHGKKLTESMYQECCEIGRAHV